MVVVLLIEREREPEFCKVLYAAVVTLISTDVSRAKYHGAVVMASVLINHGRNKMASEQTLLFCLFQFCERI